MDSDLPVREISRSIIVLRRLINDDLVSNKFNSTAIMPSASEGGHISHIARAKVIWCHVSEEFFLLTNDLHRDLSLAVIHMSYHSNAVETQTYLAEPTLSVCY